MACSGESSEDDSVKRQRLQSWSSGQDSTRLAFAKMTAALGTPHQVGLVGSELAIPLVVA